MAWLESFFFSLTHLGVVWPKKSLFPVLCVVTGCASEIFAVLFLSQSAGPSYRLQILDDAHLDYIGDHLDMSSTFQRVTIELLYILIVSKFIALAAILSIPIRWEICGIAAENWSALGILAPPSSMQRPKRSEFIIARLEMTFSAL